MAVLDHHDIPTSTTAQQNGYLAVFNVCLVFFVILGIAYLVSLLV